MQAALTSWVQLCEAMASWRIIQDEGLRSELTLLMQAFKANLVRPCAPVDGVWYLCMTFSSCAMLRVGACLQNLSFLARASLGTGQGKRYLPGSSSWGKPFLCAMRGSSLAMPWRGSCLRSLGASLVYLTSCTISLILMICEQGAQWEPYWAALEQPVREKLTIMYGL